MNHRITVELSDRAYGLVLLSDRPLAEAIEEAVLAYYDPPPAHWQPLIEAAVQTAIQKALGTVPRASSPWPLAIMSRFATAPAPTSRRSYRSRPSASSGPPCAPNRESKVF